MGSLERSVWGDESRRLEGSARAGPARSGFDEDVYLRAYETPTELRTGLARYFDFYNTRRRHSALDRYTPDAVYFDQANRNLAA